ncbi:Hypothetical predicted protein [Cloeon dipterum]|uniref:EF-hand domain-containing protein n=1 Tax=Cloeon dipterum TaxID=197152 RepID=A0A8S1D9C3_9INSE|nr:Hypothetical predicted protein [Cloeon dipterum]
MHQLFRAIGTVSCLLPWILLLSGARTAAGDNVEPSKSSQQPSLQNVPQSRADMAPNAAPFHAAPNKNPLFLRSLINSASNKLVHGAFAGKRFDAPGSPFLPPGGPLGSPGGPLGFPGSPLGSPGGLFRSPGGPFGSPGNPFVSPGGSPGPHGIPLGVPGQGLPPQAFAGGPLAGAGLQYFPQQRPLVPHPAQVAQPAGQKLTQKEFQQYMKAAAASKHVDTDNYLTKDQFQEYLKLATSDKKNKIKGAQSTLTPGEFEKLVLDAQHDLLKGKPNKGKLKTLTHEDFKKFFEKENGRPGSAATPGKKHKRGHYSPSASSFSSSGSASFSDEYSSPPKYLPAHPPKFESESEVYPEVFPAHQIETVMRPKSLLMSTRVIKIPILGGPTDQKVGLGCPLESFPGHHRRSFDHWRPPGARRRRSARGKRKVDRQRWTCRVRLWTDCRCQGRRSRLLICPRELKLTH